MPFAGRAAGRAAGRRADGQPWRAAVADPADPSGSALFELLLGDAPGLLSALATSGGYGTRFGPDPLVHHLLDPATGRSANHLASVTVAAPRATLADGLVLLAGGGPGPDALAHAGAAAERAVAACMQVTGALGFTLEFPLQRAYRRSRSARAWADAALLSWERA